MKFFARISVLALIPLLLASCGTGEQVSAEHTTVCDETEPVQMTDLVETEVVTTRGDWYVPEEEWEGLETDEYSKRYAEFVKANPHGTPDPTGSGDASDEVDPSRFEMRMERDQYSLSDDSFVSFYVTYLGAPAGEEDDSDFWLIPEYSMERWNGEAWDRLIVLRDGWIITNSSGGKRYLNVGEGELAGFGFGSVISRLIPGKYRMVAYVNYTPIYAEFELVE